MPQPNVLILRAPGTNCDQETAFAFERAGAKAELVHVNRLLESPGLFGRFQILCIPGGFSYGDDVGAGRILANQIQHHLAEELAVFKAAGKLILGICNGFQVLMKSDILLEPDPGKGPRATLTWNDSGKFEDRWVRLRVDGSKSVFLRGIEAMYLPVAHAEGKFVPRDEAVLRELESTGQLVLRYRRLSENGDASPPGAPSAEPIPYPDNPNGSVAATAGVCDSTGRVFGLMPHPERHVDPTQHPRWTRGEAGELGDGMKVFTNAVEWFA
jgi:phosphoribosylformylglycinamidine synthase I